MRNGLNVNRKINSQNDIKDELRKIQTQGSPPMLHKAVVVDVITDLTFLEEEYLDKLSATVNNPELVDVMPVNSIIARIISNEEGLTSESTTIVFPFFQSHIMLPVAPGEIVYVIYEDYIGTGEKLGYWLTRMHTQKTVEDANYTHADRRFDPRNNPGNYTTSDLASRKSGTTQEGPGFQNGGGTSNTLTLSENENFPGQNPYDTIFESSRVGELLTMEPVPRWNKRPQELVLQGSNNTLICLGEDRKGSLFGAVEGTLKDAKGNAGTIDIVAGRGRYSPKSENIEPKLTQQRVIKNSRGTLETDKAPHIKDLKDNPNEGNPDFINDAARIYVSMQSEADKNFGLTEISYTQNTISPVQPNEGQGGTKNKSYVVAKSDHIRLIARKDSENNTEGTVLLIREGESGTDLGYIYITKDGIQIEAPKIYIGSATNENEPYVLWSKYKETTENLQSQIEDVRNAMQTQIDSLVSTLQALQTSVGSAMASSVCIPFGPDPAVLAAGIAFQTTAGTMPAINAPLGPTTQANLSANQNQNIQNNVEAINHSQKIFGE